MFTLSLMLFEIAPADLWYLIAGAIAMLIFIGSAATAIKAIRGEIWSPIRESVFKPRRERRKKIDEVFERVEELVNTTNRIEAEVKPNGGHSLKDTVNRIERRTEHIAARIRHLDETSEYAIFEMDERGHFTFANGRMCELLGVDESDLLHRNWIGRIWNDHQGRILRELDAAIENKFMLDTTADFRNADSTIRVAIRIKATPHVLAGGELRGFFGRALLIERPQA